MAIYGYTKTPDNVLASYSDLKTSDNVLASYSYMKTRDNVVASYSYMKTPDNDLGGYSDCRGIHRVTDLEKLRVRVSKDEATLARISHRTMPWPIEAT